jgi:trehalose 6-phosphate phosphatase
MSMVNIQTVLARRPLGLAFDIDGTLSPYVPAPQQARIYPGVVSLLEQAREYAHVAILTSRAVENAATMVNIDKLTYIGTYGAEWSDGLPWEYPVQVMPEAQAYIEPSRYLLDLVEEELSGLLEITLERKLLGGAIHYNHCPDPKRARQMILSVLEEPVRQANMHISEGEWTIEVKPPIPEEKGQAIRRLVQHFGLQGIVFAGDDIPDLSAFIEICQLRREDVVGLSVLVQHAHIVPTLVEHADIVVQEVEGMVELLHKMVDVLRTLDPL